jgi:hypothetical protein
MWEESCKDGPKADQVVKNACNILKPGVTTSAMPLFRVPLMQCMVIKQCVYSLRKGLNWLTYFHNEPNIH